MPISADTLKNLELETIRKDVSHFCVSEISSQRIQNEEIYFQKETILEILSEIEELKAIIQVEQAFPLRYFHDMRPLLHKIEPQESYLEIEECQKIEQFIEIGATLKKFIGKFEHALLLNRKCARIEPLTALAQLIASTIDPAGQIYDNASPDLKAIRKELAYLGKQIHIQLERIQKKYAEHLQDEYITLREGRLVLPVREFSVNKVPGIVHGQSATGQTQYIEPMPVVGLNNDMQVCYQKEKKEILRILKRLAENIRRETESLLQNLAILVHLDVLQAKANYALSIQAISPEIHDNFCWHIVNGYHPLLLKKIGKQAVPLNLPLGSDYQILIITGPNAGGKTVALKTIGLLQLMLQSGMQIPVSEGSQFPVCQTITAIIGDEQSIENDLSTFSSHIMKVNRVVQTINEESLVLIDEIGSGTDPAEGAALAVTFLEKLLIPEVVTLVTTHQGALKAFAHQTPGVINGAMQFDIDSLTPRFVLETGIPGSSYAFDISRRLGVSEDILKRAEQLLGAEHTDIEKMILELTAAKNGYTQKLSALAIKETELDGLKALYKTRSDELKKKKSSHERAAVLQAQAILDNVNKTIESLIREIKESQADPSVIKAGRRTIEQLKAEVRKRSEEHEPKARGVGALKVGQFAKSMTYQVNGEITQVFAERSEAELLAGNLRIIVPFSDLMIEEEPPADRYSGSAEFSHQIAGVLNELDVRGMTGEDAIMELTKYLDQALHAKWKEVRIIHGKGTGALRKHVHAFLKSNKEIKSYRLGNYGEGDTGVTIIEI